MQSADRLIQQVQQMDGRSYGNYKRLVGAWDYGDFTLHIDRVQSDPYAPPSGIRIEMAAQIAGVPGEYLQTTFDRLAVGDFLARRAHQICRRGGNHDRSNPSLHIATPGQEILARSSAVISEKSLQLRMQLPFPARGRSIMGRRFAQFLDYDLADRVYEIFDFEHPQGPKRSDLIKEIHTHRDYLALQDHLRKENWVAFIADGAILARESGVSDRPLKNAVPFQLPRCLPSETETETGNNQSSREKPPTGTTTVTSETKAADPSPLSPQVATVTLPHAGEIRGLALKPGVTLLVGGGYHGKSTLLQALERGVYPHIPGDGRELVATDPTAMKIRAEDGRQITGVDISLFINHLPQVDATGKPILAADPSPTAKTNTKNGFSTENASGSTSQAAALIESLEAGSRTLLIDEDTSATNLLIRDQRMRQLVKSEPITPLLDRIRPLWEKLGVSTIMVMGGAGDYLDLADQVFLLDHYRCFDASQRAQEVCAQIPSDLSVLPDAVELPAWPEVPLQPRHLKSCPPPSRGPRDKVKSRGKTEISLNRQEIDLSAVSQIVDSGQAEAAAWLLKRLSSEPEFVGKTWTELAQLLAQIWDDEGFSGCRAGTQPAFLVRPRAVDVLAALNRYRQLKVG